VSILSAKTRKEIALAKEALEQCEIHPDNSVHWIQRALHHTSEANAWIVARILRQNYIRRQRQLDAEARAKSKKGAKS